MLLVLCVKGVWRICVWGQGGGVNSVTAKQASWKMISFDSLFITALRRGIMLSGSNCSESITELNLERSPKGYRVRYSKVANETRSGFVTLVQGQKRDLWTLCRSERT